VCVNVCDLGTSRMKRQSRNLDCSTTGKEIYLTCLYPGTIDKFQTISDFKLSLLALKQGKGKSVPLQARGAQRVPGS